MKWLALNSMFSDPGQVKYERSYFTPKPQSFLPLTV